MGVLGDILKQKYMDGRENKRINAALARTAFEGLDPSEDELKAFSAGEIDGSGVTPRRQALYASSQANKAKVQQLKQLFALAKTGIDPDTLNAYSERGKRAEVVGQLPAAQAADFFNNKSVAPTAMQGGVAFNKYNTDNPIIGSSAESMARAAMANAGANKNAAGARKLNAEANDTELRTNELSQFFEKDDTLASVAAANKKDVFDTPQKVTVVDENGKEKTVFAERGVDGSMRVLDSNKELFKPKGATARLNRSQATLWQDSVKAATSELGKNTYTAVDPDLIKKRAIELYQLQVNDDSAQPPQAQSQPKVGGVTQSNPSYELGQVIEHNGMRYRVDGYDSADGEPLLVPVAD